MPSSRPTNPGLANSSSWNDSGFAFAPNTNTLDAESMPSDAAQAAREKSAQVMAALKAGDTERANALMGKSTTQGQILPGMGWLKKKLNKEPAGKLQGKDPEVLDDGASGLSGTTLKGGADAADVKR